MNFVKTSVTHDVCESVKYDDQFTGQLNHKGKKGIGYVKPENCKPNWLTNRLEKDKSTKPNLNKSHKNSARTLVDIHTGKTVKDNRYTALEESNKWYLDSGCARHMTGNSKLLSDLTPHKGQELSWVIIHTRFRVV
ncbi:hypothetical protein F511_37691 [Dorcoceras hygrometricum]|uniref:Retrovirus-related Pol polyprotein from transposon TNT 1-94-like beta-barrel domain-containing protein n=1 Tax=Dorcoceras hygrometricum TaxID=472368 RepID=A0A2Z7CTL7_9LAMI|nr:hypothetical protein F511_37691 [Dorcoceras hygrometricum]